MECKVAHTHRAKRIGYDSTGQNHRLERHCMDSYYIHCKQAVDHFLDDRVDAQIRLQIRNNCQEQRQLGKLHLRIFLIFILFILFLTNTG